MIKQGNFSLAPEDQDGDLVYSYSIDYLGRDEMHIYTSDIKDLIILLQRLIEGES